MDTHTLTHTNIHMCTHNHIRTYTLTNTHSNTHLHKHTHILIHTYSHIHTHTYSQTHIHTLTHTHSHIHAPWFMYRRLRKTFRTQFYSSTVWVSGTDTWILCLEMSPPVLKTFHCIWVKTWKTSNSETFLTSNVLFRYSTYAVPFDQWIPFRCTFPVFVAGVITMWIPYCSWWILECVAKNGSYENCIWSDLCQHHVSPNVRVYDLCEKAYKYKLNLYFLHEPASLLPIPPSSSSSSPCAGDKTQGLSHARQELISELYPDWWCGFIFSWFCTNFCFLFLPLWTLNSVHLLCLFSLMR